MQKINAKIYLNENATKVASNLLLQDTFFQNFNSICKFFSDFFQKPFLFLPFYVNIILYFIDIREGKEDE
jgi:hypothetical protein